MKISVLWVSNIAAIDFHYSMGNTTRLGRLTCEEYEVDWSMSCDIDGPGGEVIKKIKISRRKMIDALAGEAGGLNSFQVSAHLIGLDVLVYTVTYSYLALY
jgi:hypothetical protein